MPTSRQTPSYKRATRGAGRPPSEDEFRRLVDSVEDYAIFVLDPEGYVRSWNRGAERLKGYAPEEIIGRHFSAFYPQDSIASGWPERELEEAARLGRFEDEGWRLRKDGQRFWANVIITALRDDEGALTGFAKVTRDLTDRRAHEERLRESEERFRLLVEGVQDYAIYRLDPDGHVVSWNSGAERITGYRADEVIGRSFEMFFPAEDVVAGRPTEELQTALLHGRAEDTGWRLRKDGARFWADVVVTALREDDGKHVGFAKVTRDASERKRMETLEEEGRHVTEFLAMLAHELRNPLAPIRNAVGILSIAPDASPQVMWCRDVIDRQSSHLSRLVDDLLDVSRITRGKLQLQAAPMDLATAVHRAVETSRPLIEARRHHLQVVLPGTPVTVHGDLTRLAQVVSNLLNNAAKYTPEGGRIAVELKAEREEAVLSVKDTGTGIPVELLERVFDLFAQGERTLDRAAGGLGIGLTLARRIVMLHGGTITAASEGAGRGSAFTVRLPRLARGQKVSGEKGTALGDAAHGEGRSILVVDDNADSASSMAMLLRMLGHRVETEFDGRAALERIATMRPEIVFLDIGLPGLSGYEVAKRLREMPGGRDIRVYAMTGYGQEEDRRRSLEAGFDGHLVKPVLSEDLLAVVDKPTPAV